MGKRRTDSGLGLGSGPVAMVFGVLIAGMVAYLTVIRADAQPAARLNTERSLALETEGA